MDSLEPVRLIILETHAPMKNFFSSNTQQYQWKREKIFEPSFVQPWLFVFTACRTAGWLIIGQSADILWKTLHHWPATTVSTFLLLFCCYCCWLFVIRRCGTVALLSFSAGLRFDHGQSQHHFYIPFYPSFKVLSKQLLSISKCINVLIAQQQAYHFFSMMHSWRRTLAVR